QYAEIQHDHDGDEDPQEQEEFALCDQVRLAGLVNQLGDFAHRFVHRQVLQLHENGHAEEQAENADEDAEKQQCMAVNMAEKFNRRQVGKLETRFTTPGFFRGMGQQGG